jgi:hypothetical protein
VSFAAITLCVASQRVFVYFVIDSVRKLLDTPSYAFFFSAIVAVCMISMQFALHCNLD